jgi:two-component system response regulator RegA
VVRINDEEACKAQAIETVSEKETNVTITANRYSSARPRLLLVDDDPTVYEALTASLGERGFDVETARSVRDAERKIELVPPRYAVVALKLPDGSGLKLVSRLKAIEPAPLVVMLTGYPSIRTAVEAIKLGAVDYLVKPSTTDEIVASFSHVAGNDAAPVGKKAMSVHRATWEYISHVLHQNNGNISATARSLSIDRRTLQRKLRKRPHCP